jgi:hypothetical protein
LARADKGRKASSHGLATGGGNAEPDRCLSDRLVLPAVWSEEALMDTPGANGHDKGGPVRCAGTTRDGSPCQGWAIKGSEPPKCIAHSEDPEVRAIAQRARRLGGANAHRKPLYLPPGTPDMPLETLDDVVAFLGKVANDTRKGLLDTKVSNAIAVLGQGIVRAIEVRDQARVAEKLERLETLERLATGRISVVNGLQRLPLPCPGGQ